jgi:uncharacterized protein
MALSEAVSHRLSAVGRRLRYHVPMTPGTVSTFRIPVSDLLSDRGERRPVVLEAVVDWSVGPGEVGPTLHADLTLEGGSGGVLVRGAVETEVLLTCHRCLVDWREVLEVSVMELLGVAEDPDGYPLDGEVADLEPLLRDAVLLEVPLAPTCRPGCLGLCAVCGGDLNTGGCAGHEPERESPFAVLRELLGPQ